MGQSVEELLDVEFRDPAMADLQDEPAKPSQCRSPVGALPPPVRPAAVAPRGEKGIVCTSLKELERGPEAETVAVGVGEDEAMVLADEPLDTFGVIRRVDTVSSIAALVAGEPPWWLPVEAAGADPAACEDRELRRNESRWLETSNGSFSGRSLRSVRQPILDEIKVARDDGLRHEELPAKNENGAHGGAYRSTATFSLGLAAELLLRQRCRKRRCHRGLPTGSPYRWHRLIACEQAVASVVQSFAFYGGAASTVGT